MLQRTALEASVSEHGWVDAPLWNRKTRHLIDGHARVELALATGEALIPVKVVEMPLAQERRLLRSFDVIGAMALVDDEALASLIESIDDAALEQLLGEVSEPANGLLPEADPDALPERVETRCKAGELWQLGEHRLLCGDATKREDVERLMGGKRASLMATDPPYAVGYDGTNHPEPRDARHPMAGDQPSRNKDWSGLYQEAEGDGVLERAFMEVALGVALLESAALYQWHADRRMDAVMAVWRSLGLNVHQLVYWVKPPVLTFSHFMGCIEPCIYGWREGHSPELKPPRDARQVWEMGRDVLPGLRTIHPTQKPVELFARPIEWHTRPSEICFEPFCGSGTQIIAAEQLGRACYALEISPEFCDVIIQRWSDATGKEAVRL